MTISFDFDILEQLIDKHYYPELVAQYGIYVAGVYNPAVHRFLENKLGYYSDYYYLVGEKAITINESLLKYNAYLYTILFIRKRDKYLLVRDSISRVPTAILFKNKESQLEFILEWS